MNMSSREDRLLLSEIQSMAAHAVERRRYVLRQIGGDTDGPAPPDAVTRKKRRYPSSLLTRQRLRAEAIQERLEAAHTALVEALTL